MNGNKKGGRNELRCEQLLEKIKTIMSLLDDIEEMKKTQPTELQKVDYELSDWFHLIEHNELNEKQSSRVIKRIHELRILRRDLKNEYELEQVISIHKNKLIGTDTRQFLLTEMNKTNKLINQDYKNRVLTQEVIEKVLNDSKVKRGRPRKEKNNE